MKLPLEDVIGLRAPELKKRFGVFGYFYDRNWGGKIKPCREILEIVDRAVIPFDFNELLEHQPELTVTMMNPGSSKPEDPQYKPVLISDTGDIAVNRTLVETKPDPAQYQIMKFMMLSGYQHARILNLSDLREGKSSEFMKLWPTLDSSHSIFASSRRNSLGELVGQPKAVLLAWSQEAKLNSLAIKTKKFFKDNIDCEIIGIPKGEHGFAYPSPMLQKHKEDWLRQICK